MIKNLCNFYLDMYGKNATVYNSGVSITVDFTMEDLWILQLTSGTFSQKKHFNFVSWPLNYGIFM